MDLQNRSRDERLHNVQIVLVKSSSSILRPDTRYGHLLALPMDSFLRTFGAHTAEEAGTVQF